MDDSYRQQAHQRILEDESFTRAVFSGPEKGAEIRWIRAAIRPVLLRGERHWQFAYFDQTRDITKNYLRLEAGRHLDELLEMPFRNLTIETTATRLEVRISKKGKPLVHETRLEAAGQLPDLSHDRIKDKWITAENPTGNAAPPFLQVVEIMTADGRVRAEMQAKLRQINEFVRLVDETGVFDRWPAGLPVQVVDFGSGKGYLTFALYHYLTALKKLPAVMVGIDLKADVLEKLNRRSQSLGWDGLRFQVGKIEDYVPPQPPDVVVALHACDTATDDALAQGLRWGSRLIVTAPCCQHYLQAQLAQQDTPVSFSALMRYGILFERMGDLLTDALRAAYLRVWGYRTEVIQFVSSEHSAKNLMIRAVKTAASGDGHT